MKTMKKAAMSMLVFCFSMLFVMSTKASAATMIPTAVNEMPFSATDSYVTEELAGTADASVVTEVTPSNSGILFMIAMSNGFTKDGQLYSDNMTVGLYEDAACTTKVAQDVTLNSANEFMDALYAEVSGGKTYYVKTTYTDQLNVSGMANALAYVSYLFSNEAKTLSSSYKLTYTADSTKAVYHKLTLKKDSLVYLSGQMFESIMASAPSSSMTASLCNSSKKVMKNLSFSSSNSNQARVMLKKGTYYIAVQSANPYQLRAKTTTIKTVGGASKKKAVLIKKNGKVNGMLTETDSTSKSLWYKIKLTKTSKFKINYTLQSDGGSIYIKLVPASKKEARRLATDTVKLDGITGANKNGSVSLEKKVSKGTYYLQVTKVNKSGSAAFTLKNACK